MNMLERLRQKWKVSTRQLVLILCVFAITGTTTAYISKAITSWVGFTEDTHWLPKTGLRVAVLLFGYQIILLTVAFFFGQFAFFWNYERKLLVRMKLMRASSPQSTVHGPQNETNDFASPRPGGEPRTSNLKPQTLNLIAIFASGAGSNARKIIEHFAQSSVARVALVVCNKPGAGVTDIASSYGIPVLMIEKERFFRGDAYLPELQQGGIRWIILAGFLWKVPVALVAAYPRRIINIHPALLPGYGGKGMYGRFVHEAVIKAGEPRSGITIHYVDEHYDNGDMIFQQDCPVLPNDTPDTLAQRIHLLEHEHFPKVIEAEIREAGY
jgi:formyltetrahydrofolate-dependent phosphoribosylglycinamide formyltransferase